MFSSDAKNKEFAERFDLIFGKRVHPTSTPGPPPADACCHEWCPVDHGRVFCSICGAQNDTVEDENHPQSCDAPAASGSVKSIIPELLALKFPRRVCEIADSLFRTVSKGRSYRCRSRRALLCVCVFSAQRNLGIEVDHVRLQTIFNVQNRTMLQGLKKLCFQSRPGLDLSLSGSLSTSVREMATLVMQTYNATPEQLGQVVALIDILKNRSSILSRCRPQSLAASIVFFWTRDTSQGIDLHTFAKNVNLSSLTVLKLYTEICTISLRIGIPWNCW